MKMEEFNQDSLEFASLMAHQLQTPLSAVSQALEAVLGEYAGPVSTAQRGTLERANARCNEAITAVRRMLTIVRSRQDDEDEPAPSPLAPLIRQAHRQYARPTAERAIDLTIEIDTEPVGVSMSEPAMVEVLTALLDNALKYTPDHGRIRISTREGEEGTIRITVEDSGAGIDEDIRHRVCQPFFRSPTAKREGTPGVGLGLAFVHSMVTAVGGSLDIGASSLGGAKLTLGLPATAIDELSGIGAERRAPTMHVVIVGGVAAGPKAAARIIRLCPEADVTVIDEGSVLSYAGCGLPYYVSGVVRDPKTLLSSPAGVVRDPVFFRRVKNVHIMNRTEALEIDRTRKRVRILAQADSREQWLPYDKLLLATGATPVVPPNLDVSLGGVFTLHGVADAEGIRAALAERAARNIVIVGAGLIGIEITEALASKGARVTLVEKRPWILPIVDPDIACLVQKHLEDHGVRVVTNTPVRSLEGDETVRQVVTDKGSFEADMVIVAIGVSPNVTLARNVGLALGETGAIHVDEHMRTSDPDIFAAGDCVQCRHLVTDRACYIPLGSTANKQARVAAVNICGGNDRFPGVMGSCICKVFHYSVARTGLGEEEARNAEFDVLTVLAPGPDREHFVPGGGLVMLKLIVDRESRRLLGAQATGAGALDKRIDAAALAIAAGMTIDDVANADLCYAPHYASAMDNLITAANVARNVLDGHMAGIKPAEVQRMLQDKEDFLFLDVRTPGEYEDVHLPGSQHVSLGALRGRLSSFPQDKPIVTFCDISLRGYEAALILKAAGFDRVSVMEGGMAMWPYDVIE